MPVDCRMIKLQDKLLRNLKKLIDHLEKYEENSWSSFFKKVYRLIDQGDLRGVEALKKMPYGGMGGFTDLVICVRNGHKIEGKEEDFANRELMRLGNEVLLTNDKLRKELRKKKLL